MKPKISTNYFDKLLPSVLSRVMPLLAFLFMATVAIGQVTMVMVPNPSVSPVNTSFDVTIQIESGATPIAGAEVHLDFDPTLLEVVNMTPQGWVAFHTQMWDNTLGTLDYVAASPVMTEVGTINLVTITFSGKVEAVSEPSYVFDLGNLRMTQAFLPPLLQPLPFDETTSATLVVGNTVPEIAGIGDASVDEQGQLIVPVSITDLDNDNLTVTVTSVSDEPQLLESNNSGTQVDPFPTSAAGFLSEVNVSSAPGSYTSDLQFDPVFGDGGGADGDGSGTYTITVEVGDEDGNTVTESFVLTVNDVAQPIAASGKTLIQAESFDNQGGAKGIGVEVNPGPGVINIGFAEPNDFAEYEIDVAEDGIYQFDFQVAKQNSTQASMTINGGPASITVTSTGGWQNYVLVSTQVELLAGQQTLRFDWSGSGFLFNIDYFEVEKIGEIVDSTSPVVTVPGDVTVTSGANATAQITVTDENPNPTVTLILYDKSNPVGSTNSPITPSTVIPDTEYSFTDQGGGVYQFDWNTTGVPGRSYLVRVTANDGSNPTTEELFSVNVAQEIPGNIQAKTFSSPLPWYGGNPPMGFVAIETSPAQNIGWLYDQGFAEYEVNVPQAGIYDVTFFAAKGTGGVFTVTLSEEDGNNGFTPLGDFAAVQGAWQQYLPYTFQVTLSSPGLQTIRLDFSGDGGVNIRDFTFAPVQLFDQTPPVITLLGDNPLILNLGDQFVDPGATALDDVDGDISGNILVDKTALDINTPGNYPVTYDVSDAAGNPAVQQVRTVNVVQPVIDPVDCPDEVLFRINVGGVAAAATDGNIGWDDDSANPGSPFRVTTGGNNIFAANVPIDLSNIPPSVPAAIFDAERWDPAPAPEMLWQFPVEPNTDVKVTLMLMEGFSGNTMEGDRVFDVSVDGFVPPAFDDLDPIKDAGSGVAYLRDYTFTITDNTLDLEFIHVVENPAIRGIQVCGTAQTQSDNTPPVITLLGDNPLVLPVGGMYVEPGATAEDDVDGPLDPMDIVIDDSAVDPNTLGDYDVIYTISDASGNEGQAIRVVSVTDQSPPAISLLGDNPLQLVVGDAYLEAGATAQDDQDGDISGNIVIDASAVNTTVAGAYVVTYNVSDAAGNAATEVTRNVNVVEVPAVDACATVLYRINAGGATIAAADATLPDFSSDTGPFGNAGNSPFLVANSTGTSTYSGTVASAHPGPIVGTHPSLAGVPYASLDVFNTERFDAATDPEQQWAFPVTPGTQVQVTLLFAELFGQIDAPGKRVFDVEIEGQILPGFNDIDQFAIAGAKGAFARSASLTVNDAELNIELKHIIENPAVKGIQVCDVSNQAPTITLVGPNVISLPEGDAFVPPVVTAEDPEDGDITGDIVVGGDAVDTNTPGTYVVTYNVTDSQGAAAPEVTLTVNVTDNTPPVITLLGDANVEVVLGNPYMEPGFVAIDNVDGNITGQVVVAPLTVDTNVLGVTNITYDVTDAAGLPAVQQVRTVTVVEPPVDDPLACDNVQFRINTGGPAVASGDAAIGWAQDPNGANASPLRVGNGGGNVFGVSNGVTVDMSFVPATVPQQIFLNERWDPPAAPEMMWEFPVAIGDEVKVSLLMMEGFSGNNAVGKRVFDVAVEGTVPAVFDDIDPFAIGASLTGGSGLGVAFILEHSYVATDETVNLDFLHDVIENPTIRGIQVCATTPIPNQPPVVEIQMPLDGEDIPRGLGVTLVATANDPEDGVISSAIEWTTNDNFFEFFQGVSTGGVITGTFVTPGTTTLTASVQDSDGLSASASVMVNVAGPEVEIDAPTENEVITFDQVVQSVLLEWSANDVIDNLTEHFHIYVNPADPNNIDQSTRISTAPVQGARSWPLTASDGLQPGQNLVVIRVADQTHTEFTNPEAEDRVNFTINGPVGIPQALVEITPDAALEATTFGGSDKFQITNQSTGNLEIESIMIDFSTAVLPDMVHDPKGMGGDASAQCFTPEPAAAATTGLVSPTDPCVDPYSVPRQGGFDVISLSFTDFNPSEFFSFTSDVDPNSLQDVNTTGNAGAVSGFELVGATVKVVFSDGSELIGCLFEDGSLGGGQTVVAPGPPPAPTVAIQGIPTLPASTPDLDQTVIVSGDPGLYVALLLMDSRLLIASNEPGFNLPNPTTYYANQALAKELYTAQIGQNGTVEIPVTLLENLGSNGQPDGGLNQIVAVTSYDPYEVDAQTSCLSNVAIIRTIPCDHKPVVDAGRDVETCEDTPIHLTHATASNYRSLRWTARDSNGQQVGSFNDDTLLDPVYTPPPGFTGEITLELKAFANGRCRDVRDRTRLRVTPQVEVDAGHDLAICKGEMVTLDLATARDFRSLSWTADPANSGTFDDAHALNPKFTPNSDFHGTIILTLTGEGRGSCHDDHDEITLTINKVEIELVATDISCDDDNGNSGDGAMDLTVVVGDPAFTFEWTGPEGFTANTEDLSGLSVPGTYSVTVTDANGCVATGSAEILPANPLTIEVASTPVVCDDDAGTSDDGTATVDVTSDGAGGISILWDDPNAQTTATATGLAAGTYTVTVTDANGCTATKEVEVAPANPLTIAVSSTPVLCDDDAGTSDDGTATVDVTSMGAGGISILWDDPNAQTTATATGLAAGTYNVIVTDANGCSATEEIVVAPANPLTITASATPVLCDDDSGTSDDGTATVDVTSDGAGGISILWDDPNAQTTATATGLAAGTYSVTVTDANGCSATTQVTVAPANPLTIEVASTPVLCDDDAGTSDDGTATVDVTSDGAGSVSILWDDPNAQTTATATGLAAGTYNVTVTDANGCSATKQVVVAPANPLTIAVSSTPVLCDDDAGTSDDGTATVDVTSNGAGGISILWNDANAQTTATATGLAAGIYTVTVTDANGCTATEEVEVAPANPLTIEIASTPVLCDDDRGTSDDGTATVDVTSMGAGGISILWDDPAAQTTATATGLAAGTYTVTVTDANGCTATKEVEVAPANPLTIEVASTPVLCDDDSGTSDDGTATVDVTSMGAGGISILWDDPAAQTTATATGLAAGTYNVVVTDANGCSATKQVTVAPANPLRIAVSSTPVLCDDDSGTSDDGTATVDVTSMGAGGISILWDDPAAQTTATATGLAAGTYTVTVTDANGCTATEEVEVAPANPLTIAVSSTPVICNDDRGTSDDGTATVDVTSMGAGGISILWDDPAAQTTATATGLAAGTYTVTVTDANGCTATKEVIVGLADPFSAAAVATDASCNAGSDGSIDLTLTNGVPVFSFSWTGPGGFTANTEDISGLVAGTYNVTVTDANGCIASASATVGEPDAIVLTASSTTTMCEDETTGVITGMVSGGTPSYTVLLSGPSSSTLLNVMAGVEFEFSGLGGGIYTVTVQDANYTPNGDAGCEASTTVEVVEYTDPIASFTAMNEVCVGGSLTFTNTSLEGTNPGAATFFWSFGDGGTSTDASPTYMFNTVGSFTVVLTMTEDDGQGAICTDQAVLDVTVNPLPTVNNLNPVLCSDDNSIIGGVIDLTLYDGDISGDGDVSWFSDENYLIPVGDANNAFVSVPGAGANAPGTVTYFAEVMTDKGCTARAELKVDVNAIPALTINPIVLCSDLPLGNTATTDLTTFVLSSATNLTFEVNNVVVNPVNFVVTDGDVLKVTAVSDEDCDTDAEITITVNPTPPCEIEGPEEVCPEEIATYSGVIGDDYTYSWTLDGDASFVNYTEGQFVSTPNIDVQAADLCSGEFTLTLVTRTPEGCESTCTKVVTVQDVVAPVIITMASDAEVECSDDVDEALRVWLASNGGATASDNCDSEIAWSATLISETPGCGPGTSDLVYEFTAADECNNVSTGTTATFSIIDTTAPVITTMASDAEVECSDDVNGALQAWLDSNGGAAASDNCDPDLVWTATFISGTPGCGPGTFDLVYEFTATDDCGNVSAGTTATFSIIDTTAPVITTMASDAEVECSGDIDGALQAWLDSNGGAAASDNCDPDLVWTATFISETPGCGPGTSDLVYEFTATDDCGNVSAGTRATFSIIDTTAPVITTMASDAEVECSGDIDGALQAWLDSNGGAAASDNCDPDLVWTATFISETPGCGPGTSDLVYEFTAADDCGNVSAGTRATFSIIDTTAPVITTMASDAEVECSGDIDGALQAWLDSNGGAAASDNCDPDLVWTATFISETPGCGPGTSDLVYEFTAADDCGNVSAGTRATFSIIDTTAPVITTMASDAEVECSGDIDGALQAWLDSNGGAAASDNCDPDLAWTATFISETPGCGPGTFDLVYEFTATDDCGNVSAGTTATFSIIDTTAPVITTMASDAEVECSGDIDGALQAWLDSNGGAAASDNCDPDLVWTATFISETPGCGPGTSDLVYEFTAADDCGNVSAGTRATFSIIDTTAPVITTMASDAEVECSGDIDGALQAWLDSNGGAAASDNCDPDLVWTATFISETPGCGPGTFDLVYEFTAADDCGNVSAGTRATFSIIDTTAPVITTMASDAEVECSGDIDGALQAWLDSNGGAAASDNCDPDLVWTATFISETPGCGPGTSDLVYEFTAADDCGNVSAGTRATFSIIDTTAPVITTMASDAEVECSGDIDGALQAWLDSNGGAAASDNCDPDLVWTATFISETPGCGPGTSDLVYEFTAADDCGNVSAGTRATFSIIDTTAPVITTMASDAEVECSDDVNGALQAWLDSNGGAAASDNCDPDLVWTATFISGTPGCGPGTSDLVYEFTAADDCGNVSAGTRATFSIIDTTAPVITTMAMDMTVECDGAGNVAQLENWLSTYGGAMASDNCGNVTWTSDFTGLSDDCGETGSATVTFTATDDCGNSTSTTATFTIVDTTPPSIDQAPADLVVECDGEGNLTDLRNWLETAGGAIGSDECSDATWSWECAQGGGGSTITEFIPPNDPDGRVYSTNSVDGYPAGRGIVFEVTADKEVSSVGLWADITNGSVSFELAQVNQVNGAVTSGQTVLVSGSEPVNTNGLEWVDFSFAPVTLLAGNFYHIEFTHNENANQNFFYDNGNVAWSQGAFNLLEGTQNGNTGNFVVPAIRIVCEEEGDLCALSDECGETGSVTVEFTLTDDCGNESKASATFTIEDTTPPTLVVPAAVTVECTDPTDPSATGMATGGDTCGDVVITFADNFDGACGETGVITRTWTATDDCGNTTSDTQLITIEDTTPPVLDIPAAVTVECTDPTDPSATGMATGSDTCGEVEITFVDSFDGACGETGVIARTWTATDDCGNTTTGTQLITIVDTTPPVLVVPAAITVECTDPTDPSATGMATGSDTCGEVEITFADSFDGACGETGVIARTWTATDDCGNTTTGTQLITIVDTTPPTLDVPAAITVECTDPTDPSATGMATGSDTCGEVQITFADSFDGACGETGVITRTWTATDDCGNTTTDTQLITIVDTTPPVLVVPEAITVECTDPTDPSATGMATGSDRCGEVEITFADSFDGACGETGVITRTWTATDDCGNTTTGTQLITIVDTTPPTLDVPAAITVECTDPTDPSATGMATGSDTCGEVEITFADSFDGACGETGVITRTWTATDDCGNTTTGTQLITIVDTTPPVLVVPAAITVECTDPTDPSATGMATGSDTCGEVQITFADSFDGACGETGVITRTWTATDDCGNTTTGTQLITIVDTTPPTLDVPAAVTVECTDPTDPSATGMATGSDTCGEVEITFVDSFDGACGETGVITRTWTATDDCGNTTTGTQLITIVDTTPPSIDAEAMDLTVECDGAGNVDDLNDWLDSNGGAMASDLCGDVTWTNDFTGLSDDCGETGSATVTFTATDDCGNESTTTATFTIEDTVAPDVFVNGQPFMDGAIDASAECGAKGKKAFYEWLFNNGGATATDVCSDEVVWTNNCPNPVFEDICEIDVIFTATDDCGNATSITGTFTFEDDEAPVIVAPDSDVFTVDCSPTAELEFEIWLSNNGGLTATDNCSTVDWAFDVLSTQEDCDGAVSSREVLFVASDQCSGLTSSYTLTFEIVDNDGPMVVVEAQDETIYCDGDGANAMALQAWIDNNGGAYAIDECSDIASWTAVEVDTEPYTGDDCLVLRKTYEFTPVDACGNPATMPTTATFTVIDKKGPVAMNLPMDAEICLGDELVFPKPTATDLCSEVTLTIKTEPSGIDIQDDGNGNLSAFFPSETTVFFIFKDACGNKTVESMSVFVDQKPIVDIQSNIGDPFASAYWARVLVNGNEPQFGDVQSIQWFKNGDPISTASAITNLEPGATYSVTVTNYEGCPATDEITVPNTPPVSCVIEPLTFTKPNCQDDPANVLTANAGASAVSYIWSFVDPNMAMQPAYGWDVTSGQGTNQIQFAAGTADAMALLTVFDATGGYSTCTMEIPGCDGEQFCSFDENFYAAADNEECVGGMKQTTEELLANLLTGPEYFGIVGGNLQTSRVFELTPDDIANGAIYNMLPGSGAPKALDGYATYSNTAGWGNVPMHTAGNGGVIKNSLLSETIVMFFNNSLNPNLPGLVLESRVLITAAVDDCDNNGGQVHVIPGSEMSFEIPESVFSALKQHINSEPTVESLFILANHALGGVSYGLSYVDIEEAVAAVNAAFANCRVLVGFESHRFADAESWDRSATDVIVTDLGGTVELVAYPNPFAIRTTIQFTVPQSTNAVLQVYDMKGMEVELLFDGTAQPNEIYEVIFDATGLPQGNYVYRLITDQETVVGNLIPLMR